jgi:hypothetical protein
MVARLATLVLEVAKIHSYKRRRLKFLATKREDLLIRLRVSGLINSDPSIEDRDYDYGDIFNGMSMNLSATLGMNLAGSLMTLNGALMSLIGMLGMAVTWMKLTGTSMVLSVTLMTMIRCGLLEASWII